MSNEGFKSLTIKSKSSPTGGLQFKWDTIPQMSNFTKDIYIPDIGAEKDGSTKVDISAIVSGMPTVYARANLFRIALDSITDKKEEVSGLLLFYSTLIQEWRGLLACIALNYEDLKVERVYLKYSDGKDIYETRNIYEPLGAFGNMLFERKPLWCDPRKPEDQQVPFIDLISYKDQLIGATSPETFIFSAVSYSIQDILPFVSQSGKLRDPLKSELDPSELGILKAYVDLVIKKIDSYEKSYDHIDEALKPKTGNIYSNLGDWLKEMDDYSSKKGWDLPGSNPPEIGVFDHPYSLLFNHSTELYGKEGVVYPNSVDGAIKFNPKELLLPESTRIAQIRLGGNQKRANRPLLLLEAELKTNSENRFYFSLPLAPLALNVFGNNLSALLGVNQDNDIHSRLSAIYEIDGKTEKLIVTLRLVTNKGEERPLKAVYEVGGEILGKDILMWPNFMSKKWNRYFLFNELPHNDEKYQVTPFIGDIEDDYFRIILDEKTKEPIYLAKDGGISAELPAIYKASIIVEKNHKVSENRYKYEIYESNQPFKGIKFSFGGAENLCGYAIIQYDKIGTKKDLPRDWSSDDQTLADARLGIDFGSSNSSVAYWSERDNVVKEKITLKNRRISLLSSDQKNNDKRPAGEDEVFFFQNDEITTNSIKSTLALHDYKRLVNTGNLSKELLMEKAVFGGFPCFEKNLPIETSDSRNITLKFERAGFAEIKHNMKWSNYPLDKAHKKAYLGSLMLHIYAQLFEEGHQPVSIKWSYPSSMHIHLLNDYFEIFNSLKDVSPLLGVKPLEIYRPDLSAGKINEQSGWDSTFIKDGSSNRVNVKTDRGPLRFNFKELENNKSLTEACAVANYFLEDYTVKNDELLLIFDVGGSTTDICVLAEMDGPEGPGKAMIKQNSVRWAAKRLAEATRYSKNFQSVLERVCEKKGIKIQGLNYGDIKYNNNTAPFFFEQFVDRLGESDYDDFYQIIAAECKELMAVNLYITGLIMYYAGQLTYKLRQEMLRSEDVPDATKKEPPKINIAFAGKGARIFDWFAAVDPKSSSDYYTNMFIRGLGGIEVAKKTITFIGNTQPIIKINAFKKENNLDVKYEVSKGLAIPTDKTKILVPNVRSAIELIGEEGFCVYDNGEPRYLDYSNSITHEMMEHLGTYFISKPKPGAQPCPKFMDFADLFNQVSTKLFGFNMKREEFMEGFQNMNIEAFIKKDPDYIEAQKRKREDDSEPFDYVAPIFILEGMKFYEDRILKWLST